MKLHPLRKFLLSSDQHCYLTCADECYFADLYECNGRQGIRPAILSLKRSNQLAINYFAEELLGAIPAEWVAQYTFVPMPRSSGRNNSVRAILQHMPLNDLREILIQKCSTPASHRGWRPSPAVRTELFAVNSKIAEPRPATVVIFDDIVTTGSHFRAAKIAIRRMWRDMNVVGIFLARACSWRQRCYTRRLQSSRPSCLMGPEGPLFS